MPRIMLEHPDDPRPSGRAAQQRLDAMAKGELISPRKADLPVSQRNLSTEEERKEWRKRVIMKARAAAAAAGVHPIEYMKRADFKPEA